MRVRCPCTPSSLSSPHPAWPGFAFFVSPSAAHRHLHSFPTRRSSDLHVAHRCTVPGQGELLPRFRDIPHRRFGMSRNLGRSRSEEHTSELQSLRHLVCRLLLEKKKQIIQANLGERQYKLARTREQGRK